MPRLIGKDLNIFAIDTSDPGASGPATTSYLTTIQECEIEIGFESQENRALKDTVRYEQPVIEGWRISFTQIPEAHSTLWTRLGQEVYFTVQTSASGDGGTRFGTTGLRGLLKEVRVTVPDGPQQVQWQITPQGESLKGAIAAAS